MTYADMITLLLCFFAVFLSVSIPKKMEQAQLQTPQIQQAEETILPRIVIPTKDEISDSITALDTNSDAFFSSGSATLNSAGEVAVQGLAEKLKQDDYKNYEITVENHTDDNATGTSQFPSNWELSSARAAAVVHYFLDQGIPARKLRAAGYADAFPKAPNRDFYGNPIATNQAQNRRIVIRLDKVEKGIM